MQLDTNLPADESERHRAAENLLVNTKPSPRLMVALFDECDHDECVGWFGWEWGSVPDWIEALGTSGALGYIAVQYHRAQTKDRAAKRDAEAAQARLVSFAPLWDRDLGRVTLNFDVNNDSAQVIREVFIELWDPKGKALHSAEVRVDADGVVSWVGQVLFWLRDLKPGLHHQLVFSVRDDDMEKWEEDIFRPQFKHALRFTDGSGIQWRRFQTGQLERVSEVSPESR